MGRSKNFVETEALERAMYLFWEKGYENTTMKELLTEMGILNGSFYNSYRNKKEVFTKTLTVYEERFLQQMNELFQSRLSISAKFRCFFNYAIDRQKRDDCPKGCYIFNCLTAENMRDLDIYRFVHRTVTTLEDIFEWHIRNAIENQELDRTVKSKEVAAILVNYFSGLMNQCVVEFKEAKIRRETEYFLVSMGFASENC